jgi:hypothetical protein
VYLVAQSYFGWINTAQAIVQCIVPRNQKRLLGLHGLNDIRSCRMSLELAHCLTAWKIFTMATSTNWMTVAESSFPLEREALEFVRAQFPAHDPYRAWSNFEFIADDGSVNEIDLLIFTPQGFFLIEIKSRPGRLRGDAGTWTWETDGKLTTVDNPYQLANPKRRNCNPCCSDRKPARAKAKCRSSKQLSFVPLPTCAVNYRVQPAITSVCAIARQRAIRRRVQGFWRQSNAASAMASIPTQRERMTGPRRG